MTTKISLSKITRNIRHSLIRVIAPTVYWNCLAPTRPMIQYVAKHLQGSLIGAEIGVAQGVNALNILKTLPITKLYLIDPYKWYFEGQQLVVVEHWYKEAWDRLTKYKNLVQFIKKPSLQASELIPCDLDFVYIDGDHSYEAVKGDILAYYPKVRRNGVLGGHDYVNFPEVNRAVNDSFRLTSIPLHHQGSDWWIVKN